MFCNDKMNYPDYATQMIVQMIHWYCLVPAIINNNIRLTCKDLYRSHIQVTNKHSLLLLSQISLIIMHDF